MSSNITLSAATRQNLLSLQDTAGLLSTTQNRLSTGKTVNSALDNPVNFFTADALSSRSNSLSSLLDGISNGIQTIQAANKGLSKLQGLTDQLKSVAQQALASSNAFTAKAQAVSGALGGATASNLLSTGPTQAVADTALSANSSATAATLSNTYTPLTGTAATFTTTAFTAPANAVASTYTGGANFAAGGGAGAKLTFSGPGITSPIDITIGTADASTGGGLAAINTAISANATLAGLGITATYVSSKLVLTNASGTAISVQASDNGTFGNTTANALTGGTAAATQTLNINGTAINVSGGKAGDSAATVLTAAIAAINAQTATTGVSAAASGVQIALTGKADGSQFSYAGSNASLGFGTTVTTTTSGILPAAQTVTINGTNISIAGNAKLAEAISAINAQSTVTGVTAAVDPGNAAKIKFTGASDGSSFTISGSNGNALGLTVVPTAQAGTFSPNGTTLATAIGFKTGDNFTVNGQTVNVTAGETLSSLAQKVSVATNGVVSASYDATNRKFIFTAADSDTAVTLGNGSTATSVVSNLGYSAGKTNFAAGLGASGTTSALTGKSLSVQVGNGQNISFTFGTAAGQVQSLTQLNTVLAGANAQATFDGASGKLTITTANDFGAENLSLTASGTGNPFNSATSAAVIGGDGATTRNNLVTSYNGLLNQINQLAADSGYNGVNLLAGDNLKLSFNEKNTSSLSVQGTTINVASLGLSAIGNTDFQENGSINKLVSTINSASNVLKSQASSLGANLAVVQNRQDFTKQIINVLDTGASALTNADLNEEAANSQALSTRNSLGISALSLANQAQQGILQLLR